MIRGNLYEPSLEQLVLADVVDATHCPNRSRLALLWLARPKRSDRSSRIKNWVIMTRK